MCDLADELPDAAPEGFVSRDQTWELLLIRLMSKALWSCLMF